MIKDLGFTGLIIMGYAIAWPFLSSTIVRVPTAKWVIASLNGMTLYAWVGTSGLYEAIYYTHVNVYPSWLMDMQNTINGFVLVF